jgi:hydrogenase/urease accessory protein HupE
VGFRSLPFSAGFAHPAKAEGEHDVVCVGIWQGLSAAIAHLLLHRLWFEVADIQRIKVEALDIHESSGGVGH